MTKILLSANEGGIANRVFCLMNVIYLARKEGTDFGLIWKEDKDVTGTKRHDLKFNDLFEKKIPKISLNDMVNKNYTVYTNEKLIMSKEKAIEILKELKFKFVEELPYAVAFHIRRGDFTSKKTGNIANISPLKKFKEVANTIPHGAWVASDNQGVKEYFSDLYNFDYSDDPKTDLEMLSKSKVMYCSYGSTFSQLAWYLGECKPYRHTLIDAYELHKWKKAKNTRWRKLKNEVGKWIN